MDLCPATCIKTAPRRAADRESIVCQQHSGRGISRTSLQILTQYCEFVSFHIIPEPLSRSCTRASCSPPPPHPTSSPPPFSFSALPYPLHARRQQTAGRATLSNSLTLSLSLTHLSDLLRVATSAHDDERASMAMYKPAARSRYLSHSLSRSLSLSLSLSHSLSLPSPSPSIINPLYLVSVSLFLFLTRTLYPPPPLSLLHRPLWLGSISI